MTFDSDSELDLGLDDKPVAKKKAATGSTKDEPNKELMASLFGKSSGLTQKPTGRPTSAGKLADLTMDASSTEKKATSSGLYPIPYCLRS